MKRLDFNSACDGGTDGSALVQAPPPERGAGRGGGGGQGRGGGRGGAPPFTGPVVDMVTMIIAALNNQDAAYLTKDRCA